MSREIIRLHFETPIHIGSGKEEMNETALTYHSDALKSAIFAIGIAYFPEWKDNPDSFFNGFRISSCFPYCGNDFFLPRPVGLVRFDYGSEEMNEKNIKVSKKLTYLSLDIYKKWMSNPEKDLPLDTKLISPDGAFVFSKLQDVRTVYKTEVQQRVAVMGEGVDSKPFYLDRVYFEKDAGLYFILECDDSELKKRC